MNRGIIITSLTRIVALAAVIGAILAPTALAQESSVAGYGGKGSEGVGVVDKSNDNDPTGPGATASGDTGGALPFTGLDIGLLVGGGVLLIAVGAALARLRPHGEAT